MKNFLVLLRYLVPLAAVEANTADHRAYLATLYDSGEMLFSGPFVPREGGVLCLRAASRERIEAIISADPFHQRGVAEYEIREFAPTKTSPLIEAAFK